ncbi:hypothetical protein MC378_11825 [Polaribacter sp. MSW13]|uniref:TonB-dependent receptor n=1 Tax=Polaribacter marinus TaxID=2916838 RepID=A0A9X2AKA1_9FLAO|nr:hypothetical protein [Polaribacter marinus]MCI2229857.1 hypothetical protein [Polaribacter marinus]
MKKGFTLFLSLFVFSAIFAQEKKKEQAKDTVKTEVVNVITKYNPKIADAKKIKKNPTIKLLKKSEKKKLEYTIFSAPVASTFTPKSGVVKGIDVGVKERIYKNYLAAGFGNYTTPYIEAFIHHSTRFENEFGLSAKYLSSQDNVSRSVLNSNFSNFNTSFFYKQEDRYFHWKATLNTERNRYNWYGLPSETPYTESTISLINPQQTYNYLNLIGEFNFIDSYIDYGKISAAYFTDDYGSKEILANFNAKLDFPLSFLHLGLDDISVKASVEFLKGEFNNSYTDKNKVTYSTVTAKLHPEYKLSYKGFSLNTGLKIIASLDSENDITNLFLFPEIKIQREIIKDYLNAYGGLTGGLKTNTYKNFTEENPYVSPTLFITQTAETSNFYLGFNGKVNNNISFNIVGILKTEEDKPLFFRNNSKSDGTSNFSNGLSLLGYEYGNSFDIFYDDVKTTTIFGEIAYDFSKKITLGTNFQYDMYTVTNAITKWNLPDMQATIFGKYKSDKWYATSNIFYVSDRESVIYNDAYPSSIKGTKWLANFVDINLNGGYHFNDKFSAFLKLNNILNSNYQRFANFDTQGFQVLGGITYKFDF